MTKDEISEALEHQREMLQVLRQRLQQRELQEAKYGINAPPEIVTEIRELTERILHHESEINQLEMKAVEDQMSLSEVEYKTLLAEVWETGIPTVIGILRLELKRLHLSISPDQAKILEREIRVSLAKESILNLNMMGVEIVFRNLPSLPKRGRTTSQRKLGLLENVQQYEYDNTIDFEIAMNTLQLIGQAIRLDSVTAKEFFIKILPSEYLPKIESLKTALMAANSVWANSDEYTLFEEFLTESIEAAQAQGIKKDGK